MKNVFLCLSLLFVMFSCSSDDNNNDSNDPLDSHFELTLNGAGFNNEAVNIDRQNITVNNGRVAITAGDENLVNYFGFYLPYPIETTTYSMVEGSSSSENTMFFSRNQSDTYYTENGQIVVSEIIDGNDGCQVYKGTIDVTLSYTSDPSQILTVNGNFEMPTLECYE